MRAGKMRHRIRIYLPSETQDSAGSIVQGPPSLLFEDWASIEPLQGREFEAAKSYAVEITHRVRMRHRPGVTEKMRVMYGERIFDIQSVINVNERNVEMQLMCLERK